MKIESGLPQTWMLFGLALVLSLSFVPVMAADSTFNDANWISMNPNIPGADTLVSAAAVDGSGNLYIGGSFTVVADVLANRIAKWDGSRWTALGTGIEGAAFGGVPVVAALAVSGSNLYVGGNFTKAGGVTANSVAKWDGRGWTPLGSGIRPVFHKNWVGSLAVSGTDVVCRLAPEYNARRRRWREKVRDRSGHEQRAVIPATQAVTY